MYDIIVIGGGPAGLTAAIYGRRQNKTVLVLEKNSFGGQTVYSPKIENYPGFTEMSGVEFSDKLVDQVLYQGAELEPAEALSVTVKDGIKTVHTDSGDFDCKALILACGAKHRLLGLSGEEDLIGNGISFCALCDGAFYKDKEVAVIGGGNSALQEAVLLSQSCKKVTVIQNLAFLTGETKLADILNSKDNVEIIYNTVVTELIYDGELNAIMINNTETGEEKKLDLDGMFVAIGLVPDTDVAKDLTTLDERGYIVSGEDTLTNVEGVFAAGDCRTKGVRQIATAIADGASAALGACKYIENN
ncbi:MAG: FAD-dependent oxidoreductase [Clostridia bacterium]|nr:FAD-dependent oxidoreductase [Clostridia bacterium]